MAKSVISYDKDLPEIPDRWYWEPPTSYLRKKEESKDEFETEPGRRPSKLLLVNKLRQAVDEWRESDYPGASPVAQRLFTYWFEEDHLGLPLLLWSKGGCRKAHLPGGDTKDP